jgi:hypothetical protein
LSGLHDFGISDSSTACCLWSQFTSQFSIWWKISAYVTGFKLNSRPVKIILQHSWRRLLLLISLFRTDELHLTLDCCPANELSDDFTGDKAAQDNGSIDDCAGEPIVWTEVNGDAGFED